MSWLTVVTVVKDDLDGLVTSRDSMAMQELSDVQWVVVDSSQDSEAVRAATALLDCSTEYEWCEPRGIYPAMNRGIELAVGEFVYFLNAGDEFADADVLERVRPVLTDSVWGFGPVVIVEQNGTSILTPEWNYHQEQRFSFSRGLFPPHQGTFTRRTALTDWGGFDTSYRIAADYAMALRLSKVQDPVILTFPIAVFREGGVSTLQWRASFSEFHRARREILRPRGTSAVREYWETLKQFGLVFAHREVMSRLGWKRVT